MQVEITNITGKEPFDIFVCDINDQNCVWVDNILESDLPYTFNLPEIFSSYENNFNIKFVDDNLCSFSTTSVQATPTPTPTNTTTPTQTPTNTVTPSFTPTNTVTPSITATNTLTPSPTLTESPAASQTSTPTLTRTPTITPTTSVTQTVTPTNTQTSTPTVTPTNTESPTPTNTTTPTQTETPTNTPTETVTPTQTATPTVTPTVTPTQTITPTKTPTPTPSFVCNCYSAVTFYYSGSTSEPTPTYIDISFFDCTGENFIIVPVGVDETYFEDKYCIDMRTITLETTIPSTSSWGYSSSGLTCCDVRI